VIGKRVRLLVAPFFNFEGIAMERPKPRRGYLLLALACLVAGCGSSDEGAGAGGVTPDEARALNEAAAMLDARSEEARDALRNEAAAR